MGAENHSNNARNFIESSRSQVVSQFQNRQFPAPNENKRRRLGPMGHITLNRVLRSASSLLGMACIFGATMSCNHQPVAASVPSAPPPTQGNTSKTAQKLPMLPDQVNTTGWDRAWTNLMNVVEQSFTPSLSKLAAVEVELVVGNPGPARRRTHPNFARRAGSHAGCCGAKSRYRKPRPRPVQSAGGWHLRLSRRTLPNSPLRRPNLRLEICRRWICSWCRHI